MEFKDMSFNKKLEHIWEYYKIHIFGVIFLVVLLSFFIYDQTHTKKIIGNVTVISNQVTDDNRIVLQDEMNKLLVTNSKKQQVEVNVFPIEGTGENQSQYVSKLEVQLVSGEIDFMVLSREYYNDLLKSEMLLKLDGIEGIDFSSSNNKLMRGKTSQGEGSYGISAEGNEYLKSLNVDTKGKVFAIVATSKHQEDATKILKWFCKQ